RVRSSLPAMACRHLLSIRRSGNIGFNGRGQPKPPLRCTTAAMCSWLWAMSWAPVSGAYGSRFARWSTSSGWVPSSWPSEALSRQLTGAIGWHAKRFRLHLGRWRRERLPERALDESLQSLPSAARDLRPAGYRIGCSHQAFAGERHHSVGPGRKGRTTIHSSGADGWDPYIPLGGPKGTLVCVERLGHVVL